MQYLKQATASQSVLIGPFVDSTDGVTAETGLTIANTDIRLSANGGNMFAKTSGGGTHDEIGYYTITLDATDTATVGRLQLAVAASGALPVYHEFTVLEENVYDAMFGASAALGTDIAAILADTGTDGVVVAGTLDVNTVQISGSAPAANNLETLFDGNEGFYSAYSGPRGPGVYLNDAAANTNTTNGVDGTIGNPVSTIAAAKTLADSMSLDRIYLVNDTSITLAATMTDYEFVGIGEVTGNIINLGNQDVSASAFYNVTIQGVQGGAGRIYAEDCAIQDAPAAAVTTLHIFAKCCGFVDTFEVDTSNDNVFDSCYSLVAGSGYPVIVATGLAGTIAVRHYSGGLGFNDLSASHNVSFETDGQVVFESGCNVNANVSLRGNMTETDNTAGMNNVTREAVFNRAAVNAEADTAISDAALATAANLATVDTVVDAIKVVTDNLPDSGALTTLQADTDDIQTRLPAALVGGKMDSNVGAISASTAAADQLELNVEASLAGTASGTPTTTTMVSDIAVTVDDQFKGRTIIFQSDTTTAALRNQATDITACTAASNTLTFTALTTAPSSGDTFVIV